MQKKSVLVVFYLLLCFYGYSQNYNRRSNLFRQEISLGFVKPISSTVGFSFATEPKFSVINKLAIGLRLEGSIWLNTDNQRIQTLDFSEIYTYSVVPTVDYYFIDNTFKPFVGVGYGLYFYPQSSFYYKEGNNTGFLARAGFEAGHFRLGLNYNYIRRNYYSQGYGSNNPVNWGYFDLKFGVVIGGGQKNRDR